MTPHDFRDKWTGHELRERQAYVSHFNDLCQMLGYETPAEADPKGEWFCFEYGAEKLDGTNGFADVWKRGCFGWEYKGLHANLEKAFEQLLQYRESLENPPLLVVCDTDRIVVHTNFTNTVKQKHEIPLEKIEDAESLRILRAVFTNPDSLRPQRTPDKVTEEAAARVAELADRLRARNVSAHDAAHLLMKLIFCLFAEDIGLLPAGLMTDILRQTSDDPSAFDEVIRQLFQAMANGGRVLLRKIDYFNGGLFADEETVPLQSDELAVLADVSRLDWSSIEPAIFGTLFERSLDPSRRAQLGTHYTSRHDIEDIIEPVLMAPLREEWAAVRERCDALAAKARARTRAQKDLQREVEAFMGRLASVKVLDPACGSGNFLYVALEKLNDLEKEVMQATGPWRVQVPFRRIDPSQLHGLEIDPYAAELAQLTVWIGYLQWMHFNGYLGSDRPILRPLHNIEQRDAILATDQNGNPTEPEWPQADVIVGNPPFLGGKRLRTELGSDYVDRLFRLYEGRVPREADLCCYWFERARAQIATKKAGRAGLLATNSIRVGTQMRPVLQRIADAGGIFMAWSDREWVLDGAAVRISMVGFDDGTQQRPTLDGAEVPAINADLTAGLSLLNARPLRANVGISFMGDTKGGAFDIPEQAARAMLAAPSPAGRSNADVVRPWCNGWDIARRRRGMWIIDFGCGVSEEDAALYEVPFEYVRQHIWPERKRNRRKAYAQRWWLHVEPRPAMRRALAPLTRYLVTVAVAKFRLFVWLPPQVLPDHSLFVFARDDDYFLGALHARPHETWSLRMASSLEDRPRYIPTTCFDPFPFPRPTDDQRAAIAEAAKRLHEVRQSALDADPKLTMTGLYNKRPTWLRNLHRNLDEAVFAAYGWPSDLSDDELLEKLLALNLERAEEESRGIITPP
jgi:type II restriction/modification system DNA methylase subunit YeeA